jgi:preprotein translocase SecE subunit
MKALSYLKESYLELQKVKWPSRNTALQYTAIVVLSSIIATVLIGGVDFLLVQGLGQILSSSL